MLRDQERDAKFSWRGIEAGEAPHPAHNEERRVCSKMTSRNDKKMTTKKTKQNTDNQIKKQNDMVERNGKIMTKKTA